MDMSHGLPLISTITLGFTAAFVCGVIASKLRFSPIVGYLIAGIIIGPFTPGVVADVEIAKELSEIGILFLMFGVGLHFSIKDLWEVKNIAVPGAIVQIAAATVLGVCASSFWGWPLANGLLLGLALSVASTVVLLRALEEHNLLQSTNGHIVIGWLIVEDIAMVLALVFIPAVADINTAQEADNNGILSNLFFASSKVVLFILVMMVVGKRILPWLLTFVARTRSRELFTLAVFAVAMGVAFSAAKLFGVSFALGAFFAGMMIRESDLSKEAAEKALPLQDAFAVLFFVSIGMLFNPDIIFEKPLQVFIVVAIIMVGKSIAASIIVILFRYPLKTALLVSAGLAQIGEFSFILANLGVAHNILSEEGRDLILAGALISISLNPAFFHISRSIYEWIARHPNAASMFNLGIGDNLTHLSPDKKQAVKELVILVGHGRVGKHISENLKSANIEMVIIDANRQRIEALRSRGFNAIVGDASNESALQEAAIEKAVAIIVAVPNPFEARKIAEAAKTIKPHIKILVRAHNEEEEEYFIHQGVDLAVMGPREVGRRMVEYLNSNIIKS
jgi:CPA2 family monovalent cation:H+ antiporter-2